MGLGDNVNICLLSSLFVESHIINASLNRFNNRVPNPSKA